jgi:hypothetical protein
MTAYQQAWTNYNSYNQTNEAMIAASATRDLENAAAKLQKESDKLKTASAILQVLGGIAVALGTIMLVTPWSNIAGWILIGVGAAMIVAGIFSNNNSQRMLTEKAKICNSYNTISTEIMQCPEAQAASTVDGLITITNNTSSGTSTGSIPDFIDPTTGLCKGSAPKECLTLVSSAPKDCFKGKAGGPSCIASMTIPKQQFVTHPNGSVTTSINGKSRTFSPSDFESEASMVKAGFTAAQAKQFMSNVNDPSGVFAKNGINAKGELKDLSKGISMPMASGLSGSSSSAGKAAESMNMKKDEYKAVETKEVASAPASAEGLTKDYNGDMIGSDGDDLFKMMNRRYILKKHQNIFLDQ